MTESTPDFVFAWNASPDDARSVRLFFDAPPSIGADQFQDLVNGADHAHDEDTLEAIMASFAERHGFELDDFDASEESVAVRFSRRHTA